MSLRRAKYDKWVFGVCGGIARSTGWSSNVVRLIVVLLALFLPGVSTVTVVVIYVLLGVILPESEEY